MHTMTLPTPDAVSALVLTLPEADRLRLVAEATEDGYMVVVPDDMVDAVAAFDLDAAMIAALEVAARAAIDRHVETVAIAKGYNSAASCASYVPSTNQAWAAEARAFVSWRDAVWTDAFATLASVKAGTAPPTLDDLMSGLPVIDWPEAA